MLLQVPTFVAANSHYPVREASDRNKPHPENARSWMQSFEELHCEALVLFLIEAVYTSRLCGSVGFFLQVPHLSQGGSGIQKKKESCTAGHSSVRQIVASSDSTIPMPSFSSQKSQGNVRDFDFIIPKGQYCVECLLEYREQISFLKVEGVSGWPLGNKRTASLAALMKALCRRTWSSLWSLLCNIDLLT